MPEVSVVGGGPCGSLLAIVLQQRGYKVTVFEYRHEDDIAPTEGGKEKLQSAISRSINIALSHRGISALKQANVDAPIMEMAITMDSRYIHLPDGGCAVQAYGKPGDAIYSVGPRSFIVNDFSVRGRPK